MRQTWRDRAPAVVLQRMESTPKCALVESEGARVCDVRRQLTARTRARGTPGRQRIATTSTYRLGNERDRAPAGVTHSPGRNSRHDFLADDALRREQRSEEAVPRRDARCQERPKRF